jgi:hypothetical protein
VDAASLRYQFNTVVASLIATSEVWSERVLRNPTKEPTGTRSQMLLHYDVDGKPIALTHRYLRPDGTLGASGQPDPKVIVIDNVVYGTK